MKVSNEILELNPYKPGKPISEVKREFGLTNVTKLASNENPLGVSKKVLAAITQAASELNRYPDPSCYELKREASKYYKVDEKYLTIGNGSNELIDLLIRIYCEAGEAILTSQAAFIAYKICAQVSRVKTIEVPLKDNLNIDIKAFKAAYTDKVKLIFLPNPNNPTGCYINQAELTEFLEDFKNKDVLIILDEAYNEFVRAEDYPNGSDLFKKYDNLVLLKTLSKVFGIAGLRLGIAQAQPEVIDLINKIRNPFNVNSLAQAGGIAAFNDTEYLQKSQQINWNGLDYFYQEFEKMGIKYWESQANFVLFDTARNPMRVFEALLKKGVIMRPVVGYGLKTQLRLSIGLEEENKNAIDALKSVLQEIPEGL